MDLIKEQRQNAEGTAGSDFCFMFYLEHKRWHSQVLMKYVENSPPRLGFRGWLLVFKLLLLFFCFGLFFCLCVNQDGVNNSVSFYPSEHLIFEWTKGIYPNKMPKSNMSILNKMSNKLRCCGIYCKHSEEASLLDIACLHFHWLCLLFGHVM